MKDECQAKVRSLLNEMSDKKGNLIVGKTLLKVVHFYNDHLFSIHYHFFNPLPHAFLHFLQT